MRRAPRCYNPPADKDRLLEGAPMAEQARDLLKRDIEGLRTDVLKAGVLNAKALQESAETHVAHLHLALHESAELHDASFQVVNGIIAFARQLYSQAAVAESEKARRGALAAVDRLAEVLERAELRQVAPLSA